MSDLRTLLPVALRPIGGQEVNAIDGRTLHSFLEVGKDFTSWMKDHIESFGFVEHQDFEVFTEIGEKSKGRPASVYILSIPMAKELAMVQRSSRGKQARLYFIECERVALARPEVDPVHTLLSMSRSEILELALGIARERDTLQAEVSALEPKAMALDRIATADHGAMAITNAAKALQVPPKKFFGQLSEMHWIYRRAGGSGWIAYQSKIQAGYLEHKVTTISKGDGSEKVVEQVLVTPRGLARLAQLLHRDGFQPSLGIEA